MPARPPPSIVMLQTVMRPSIESAWIAAPAYSTTWPVMPPTPNWPSVPRIRSLAVTPKPSRSLVADAHRAGALLDHALCGEHMLDLGGADPEGQRPECAVGGGVRVPADDRHSRLGDAQLGADHVHDPLTLGAERVDGYAKFVTVALERFHLHTRELVLDAGSDRCAVGWGVVVGGRQRAVRSAQPPTGEPQSVERLRACHLVHQMQVDVEQAGSGLRPRGPPRSSRTSSWVRSSCPLPFALSVVIRTYVITYVPLREMRICPEVPRQA